MEPSGASGHEAAIGKSDWAGAAGIAISCSTFLPDEEDEQVADEPLSCYNCRYRRWTAASFTCCKGMPLITAVE
jgi:hypothetical protein